MTKKEVNFSSHYELTMMRHDKIHGLVSWFDCIFEDAKQPHKRVVLSTSPFKKTTHWKQTTFFMDLVGYAPWNKKKGDESLGIEVKKGDILSGSLAC